MSDLSEATRRARRRKSSWNLLLIPACFGSWIGIFLACFLGAEAIHTLAHSNQSSAMANKSAAVLMTALPLLFFALPLGFIAGNFLVRLVGPARRALDCEAKSQPGTSFFETQRAMIRLAIYVCPIAMAVALGGALLPW